LVPLVLFLVHFLQRELIVWVLLFDGLKLLQALTLECTHATECILEHLLVEEIIFHPLFLATGEVEDLEDFFLRDQEGLQLEVVDEDRETLEVDEVLHVQVLVLLHAALVGEHESEFLVVGFEQTPLTLGLQVVQIAP